jgi:DNA-binding transcriptional regulator YiaG
MSTDRKRSLGSGPVFDLRCRLNLSQVEFALKADMSLAAVRRYEKYGKGPRTLAARARLAELRLEAAKNHG